MNQNYIYSFRRFLGLCFLFCLTFLFNSCDDPKNEEGVLKNRFIIQLKSYLNAELFKKSEEFFKEKEKYTKEELEGKWSKAEEILPLYKKDTKTTIQYKEYKGGKVVVDKILDLLRKR